METMAPTDERLEERFDGIDRRFDEADRRMEDHQAENRRQFEEVNRRIGNAQEESNRQFGEVNRRIGEMNRRLDSVDDKIAELQTGMISLHATLNRGALGVIATLIGVMGAILLRGG
jgi:chromosome segregation ATPase